MLKNRITYNRDSTPRLTSKKVEYCYCNKDVYKFFNRGNIHNFQKMITTKYQCQMEEQNVKFYTGGYFSAIENNEEC